MKLGILGGTFDPPHLGHLVLADQCAAALCLDRVFFIPAFQPPHKLERELSPFEVRLEMIGLAIAGDARFSVLTLEKERGGISYAVDTLTDLHRLHEGSTFWLLLGQDSLVDLPTWKDPERIASLARLAVYRREGSAEPLPGDFRARAEFVDGPLIDVSSTQLRQRLRRGLTVRHLVPEPVLDLIRRRGLYT